LTNVLILYTAALLRAYCAFATTFEALEAPFFWWERVLQYPGPGRTVNKPKLVPEEFVAEENINYWKDMLASEGANADNRAVKMANLPSPQQEESSKVTRWGPLTFDLSSPTKDAKDVQLSAANKQAKLMRSHNRLGHLTFPKLKQLALNGKIPKKLAKVLPPKWAGCQFGAMTKLPWQGKETKANHEVFIATKPGECLLVDQMTLTEVRFYAQLKGKLTKKRYKCAIFFVDLFSCLRFQSKATTHLLGGKCPLPKQHCQASHPISLGKCMEATAPCAHPLAWGSPLCTVAICLAQCHLPSQQPTSAGWWHI
jgi:hypothetical protein